MIVIRRVEVFVCTLDELELFWVGRLTLVCERRFHEFAMFLTQSFTLLHRLHEFAIDAM